jgi:hypothetical protein
MTKDKSPPLGFELAWISLCYNLIEQRKLITYLMILNKDKKNIYKYKYLFGPERASDERRGEKYF